MVIASTGWLMAQCSCLMAAFLEISAITVKLDLVPGEAASRQPVELQVTGVDLGRPSITIRLSSCRLPSFGRCWLRATPPLLDDRAANVASDTRGSTILLIRISDGVTGTTEVTGDGGGGAFDHSSFWR